MILFTVSGSMAVVSLFVVAHLSFPDAFTGSTPTRAHRIKPVLANEIILFFLIFLFLAKGSVSLRFNKSPLKGFAVFPLGAVAHNAQVAGVSRFAYFVVFEGF